MEIKPIVDLYSKVDCHLCEVVKKVIYKVKEDTDFELNIIDITTDTEIFEKYKYEIPVVNINGIIAFKYKIDEIEFRKKLKRKF
jgi:hypothetical protein